MNTRKLLTVLGLLVGALAQHFAFAKETNVKVVPACSAVQSSSVGPALPKAGLTDESCKVYLHEECEKSDTCDLEEVGFWSKQFKRDVKKTLTLEPEHGAAFYGWYKTKTLDTLEKYVFVQYVRGCSYDVVYWRNEAWGYFVENATLRDAPVCFPDWEIDMSGSDPAYTSESQESLSRHYYAQWTDIAREFPTKFAKDYGVEKPLYPILGMVDSPSRAYVRKWGNGKILAHNVALQFRTCLYRATDVPTVLDRKGKISALPLRCATWESMHVYDPIADKIVIPSSLPEICNEIRGARIPFDLNPKKQAKND